MRTYVAGRSRLTNVGPERVSAERALARSGAVADETVSDALEAWLSAKSREPGARPNSLRSYRSRAGHVRAYFGNAPVRSLRPTHLTQFVHDLLSGRGTVKPLAPATVQGIYATLTSALRLAVRRGVIPAIPIPLDGPGIPQPLAREHHLSLTEVEAVIADMPGVWGRVAELILLTGLRWGEAVALEPGDIEGHVVRVRRTRNRDGGVNAPKTRSGVRLIPLSGRAAELLDGLDLPVGGDYRIARKALVAALGDLHRPGMGWHTLRSAHATLLDSAGVALRDQAARMGHGANYAQTLAYGLLNQAGTADELDALRQRASPRVAAEDELQARRARRAQREAP